MNNDAPRCDDVDGNREANKLGDLTEEKGEESFVVVKSRKGKRKSKGKVAANSNFGHDIGDCKGLEREITESKEDVLRKINNCINHLRTSDYYSKFLENITAAGDDSLKNVNIFCLGLGPISSHLLSRISRYQLALLVLLKEELHASVEVFDPVFNSQEKYILSVELGFDVSEVNEEGKRVIESPTLIFMPHCPHQLVNNLLYANWNPASLQKCYIVCNSFSEAVSSIPSKYLDKRLYYLSKAHSICTEIPLPNIFTDHPDVFNDIALHVFHAKSFLNLSEEFWLDTPCPVYSEQDFISNEDKR